MKIWEAIILYLGSLMFMGMWGFMCLVIMMTNPLSLTWLAEVATAYVIVAGIMLFVMVKAHKERNRAER